MTLAQSADDPTQVGFEIRFDRVELMLYSVDALLDWDYDGLLFTIDEQIIALHGDPAESVNAQACTTVKAKSNRKNTGLTS